MNQLRMLTAEHRLIESVLDAIDPLTVDPVEGNTVSTLPFLELEDFIRLFADRAHHAKEERVLFHEMSLRGLPLQGGPLGCMMGEHAVGRRLTERIGLAARACQAGNAEAAPELLESTRSYSRLLRAHIQKEDQVLYPMALALFDDEILSHLEERFVAVDATPLPAFEAAARRVIAAATRHLEVVPASAFQQRRSGSI